MKIDIIKFIKQLHLDENGHSSPKKWWGSEFFLVSIIMGFIILFRSPDRFEAAAIFISIFLGAGLTLYGFAGMMTIASKKIDVQASNPPAPDNIVKVENVESLTTAPTKINTDRVENITSQNTTVNQPKTD